MSITAQSPDTVITPENAASLQTTAILGGHSEPVVDVSFNADSTLIATAADDTSFRLWSAPTGEFILEAYEHASFVKSAAFSPTNPAVLATSSWDRTVMLWDVSGEYPEMTGLLQGFAAVVEDVVFSSDGESIAFGVGMGSVRVVSATSGEEVLNVRLPSLHITTVAFSPDGEMLAAAGGFPETSLRLIDVATGEETAVLEGHEGAVTTAAFSPDGDLIATGGDDATVRLWREGESVAVMTQAEWVMDVAFSPDGALLAIALQDDTVRLWDISDVANPREVAVLEGHEGAVNAVAFNATGTLLLSASDDTTARLWQVTQE